MHHKTYFKDMDSACVYEEKTVIHELTQGIQMANQLSVNMHTPEVGDFLIQKILSSYENALFALQSGYSHEQPVAPTLPESFICFQSPGSENFEFDQAFSVQQSENAITKKRKWSATWEDDQVRTCRGKGIEGDIIPSSTSFGLIDDYHQLHFPSHCNEEVLQVYSPRCMSPVTSESNLFAEWGSSPSLDFPVDLEDAPLDFEFIRSLF